MYLVWNVHFLLLLKHDIYIKNTKTRGKNKTRFKMQQHFLFLIKNDTTDNTSLQI